MTEPVPAPALDAEAFRKAQKRRNMWLALALVAFVAIVGITTAIRIQQTDFGGGDRLYFSGYMNEAAKEKAARESDARAEEALAAEQSADTASEKRDE